MSANTSQNLMRAAFLGHGSPMNALEDNRYTAAWRAFGAGQPVPRAVLVISAHWYINASAVTAMERPRTIHDFYGFPQKLFEMQYPAPGSPAVAEQIADLAKPTHVGRDDSWGLDHGAWSVLLHAFPQADVPVVQLSINALRDFDYHLELAARLAPLREQGVMILASGNVVHNLGALDWGRPDLAYDWAMRFDEAARSVMTERPGEAPLLRDHADYRRSVPTPEHFIPLLYLAGLAAASGRPADVLVQGHAFGSVSMTAYALDTDVSPGEGEPQAAALQHPEVPPAEETNL